MFGLAEELPHILRGGDGDDNGGACDANEEHHFQQTHAEENDRHGRSVQRSGRPERRHSRAPDDSGEYDVLKDKRIPDGRLRLLTHPCA